MIRKNYLVSYQLLRTFRNCMKISGYFKNFFWIVFVFFCKKCKTISRKFFILSAVSKPVEILRKFQVLSSSHLKFQFAFLTKKILIVGNSKNTVKKCRKTAEYKCFEKISYFIISQPVKIFRKCFFQAIFKVNFNLYFLRKKY